MNEFLVDVAVWKPRAAWRYAGKTEPDFIAACRQIVESRTASYYREYKDGQIGLAGFFHFPEGAEPSLSEEGVKEQVFCDMTTAHVVLQVYKALNYLNKSRMIQRGPAVAIHWAWKLSSGATK